jgi:hypothetical protein
MECQMSLDYVLSSVLWIRTSFNAELDPDPAFLNADPDPGGQANGNPCESGSGSWSYF